MTVNRRQPDYALDFRPIWSIDECKSVLVVVNKWDAIPKDSYTMQDYTAHVRQAFHFLDYVPVLFISALKHTRVQQVLPLALRVQEERLVRIPTGELNRIIREALEKQAPPTKAGKRLRIFYGTQPRTDPPTFVFHVNEPALVHFSYERYLENQIRRHYPFTGTPLRLSFRRRSRAER